MNIHSQEAMLQTPTTTPARKPRSDKRRDIMEAALDLFVERGFHGTAVPALAQRAGVGAGTIYRYFQNKEALVNELYRHWKGAIAAHVVAGMSTDLPARELFGRLWTQTIEFAAEHPKAFAFLELHHHSSYLDSESQAVEERAVLLANTLITVMQARGAVKEMPSELLMSLIYGAIVGFVRGASEGRYELDEMHSKHAETCTWEAIRL